MTNTIAGLFSDHAAIESARGALVAAGFTRIAAYTKDEGEQDPHAPWMLLVEAEGRETEARRILRRAGAQSLVDRPPGSRTVPAPSGPPGASPESPPEERHPHGGSWLREIVFGLNDGLVTTLVFIVAASAVAQTHAALLLVVLSEVIAGGVSMLLGGYLAARTERDLLAHRIATERQEIEQEPEEERAELRAIYRRKGMAGPLLELVVAHQTAEQGRWLRALIHDELGVVEETERSPLWQGVRIGVSFVLGGLIPTLPVFLAVPSPWLQLSAYSLTAITALGLGALKTRYSLKSPLRNALEFLAVVTAGTAAGVVIGAALHAV